ncbi:hypothetical protein HDU79_007514 [Rhizoclosmatium sp. JEL0117]|nr:hypothetical protein HDU79_007514 [Rhizoclosmatium sp. JEL0117]
MAPAVASAYKPISPIPGSYAPPASVSPTSTLVPTVETVENKIRAHIFAKRIRLVDLFADFDKLRSGLITASQFKRCLFGAMQSSAPLTETEFEILVRFYGVPGEFDANGKGEVGGGRVKWVDFVDSIDKVFGAKKLESTPTLYIPSPHEVVIPFPPPNPLLSDVIDRLRQYVKHHGSDVKTWFKDFDKYNGGYITANQFRRGIPQNVMSQEEEDLLVEQYCDKVTGSVNYFKMNTDVNRKVKRTRMDQAKLVKKDKGENVENEKVPIGTEELLHAVTGYWPQHPSVRLIEEFIQKQVYRDRIRLIEFFRDYDRHNNGVISEGQFRAGMERTEIPLDDTQMKILINAYKDKEGRFMYRKFCFSIEEIFTKSNLLSDPLAEVHPPTREFLVLGINELSKAEEARMEIILNHFRTLMRERRLLLAPFFEDFDRKLGRNVRGLVTRSHFSRLLSTMRMDVKETDLHLLFKKFENKQQTKVNYIEFLRAIDPETYPTNRPLPGTEVRTPTSGRRQQTVASHAAVLQTVMDRLRYHAATKRIRVSEFFRDFDKLRCYSIPRHEFIRGINRIGLSFTDEEYEELADAYADKSGKKGCCKWKEFEQDIEKVFNDTNLESQPTKIPQVANVNTNPFTSADFLTNEEHITLRKTMKSLAEHWKIRRTSIKPFFKDFDKLCTGHVTKIQFRQCLTYLKVDVSDAEFEVLCKRFSKSAATRAMEDEALEPRDNHPIKENAERICYLMFLLELNNELEGLLTDPTASNGATDQKILKYGKAIFAGEKIDLPAPAQTPPKRSKVVLSPSEVTNLLTRIKVKAKTERIRVIDFMADFDHLKHGKITKNEFRRALKVIYLNLTEPELETLEALYQNTFDPGMVNYVQFSDAVESVFTHKGLVHAPTMEPTPFESSAVDPMLNALTESEQKILDGVLVRLREKVRQRRIDVLSYLEDFDFVKEGTITTNQFRSVLGTIKLPVDDAEITVLARRFTQDKNMDRINYRAFAAMIASGAGERVGGIW